MESLPHNELAVSTVISTDMPNREANQRQAVLTDVQIASLASFFAGEGNITISSNLTLYAALGNTEHCWVKWFHDVFQGSFYVEKPKYNNAKAMFRWRVSGELAEQFLKAIRPFLMGEKAAQLEIALRFQAIKTRVLGCRYTGYPTTIRAELEKCRSEMQQLRRAAAETNRRNAAPWRSDSPILQETAAA